MKLSKQQLGLMIVAGAGVSALALDHFVFRAEGGLSSAAAAVVSSADSPLTAGNGSNAKDMIDRSSASIAERLERLPVEARSASRDAFSEPWRIAPVADNAASDVQAQPTEAGEEPAPWKLTSVSSIGGKVAVVLRHIAGAPGVRPRDLEHDIVLTVGAKTRDDVELVDASAPHDGKPWEARVRRVATGKIYLLTLDAQAASEKE